jgi:hypothetical protein
MEHASGYNSATRAIGGLVFLAAIISLCFQLTETFAGGRLAFAGRLLGPAIMALIGAHLFLQRRPHPLFAALLLILSVLSLLFVLLGLRH